MNYYEYKAKNPVNNKISKGIITSDNIEAATISLKKRGVIVLEVDYLKDFLNIKKISYSLSNRITKRVICEFFAILSCMLDAGMSLHEALVSLRDFSVNKKLRVLARPIAEDVRKGDNLSHAMEQTNFFNNAIVQQVNSGEQSGDVPNALERIVKQMEREIDFVSKIKNAMTYPILIVIVMTVVLWVLMTLVVPALAKTLVGLGGELPLITKIVIGISNIMSKATPYLILFIIAIITAYKIMMKQENFKYSVDGMKLKIPFIGNLLMKLEMSRFCRNLSAMQQSGITLVTSLKITRTAIKNVFLQKAIEKATKLVELSGMNLSTALSKVGKFPELMMQFIDVGINSGQISDVLDKVANQYEKDIDVSIKHITGLVEPIMIVVVGLLAGTVVLAMMSPMYSILDNL